MDALVMPSCRVELTTVPRGFRSDLTAFLVRDDGLEPAVSKGDIVLCSRAGPCGRNVLAVDPNQAQPHLFFYALVNRGGSILSHYLS